MAVAVAELVALEQPLPLDVLAVVVEVARGLNIGLLRTVFLIQSPSRLEAEGRGVPQHPLERQGVILRLGRSLPQEGVAGARQGLPPLDPLVVAAVVLLPLEQLAQARPMSLAELLGAVLLWSPWLGKAGKAGFLLQGVRLNMEVAAVADPHPFQVHSMAVLQCMVPVVVDAVEGSTPPMLALTAILAV